MASERVLDANDDVRAAIAAVEACFEEPTSRLSVEELSERSALLIELSTKVDALRADTIVAADVANVGPAHDQRNVANHLAEITGCDPAEVRADVRLGSWLQDFPELVAAYRAGSITTQHVDLLRKADNHRVHEALMRDQTKWLRWLTTTPFRDLDDTRDEWLLAVDPDGQSPEEHAKATGLTLRKLPGGLWKVDGILDPLQGAVLNNAVGAESRKLRRVDDESGISRTVRRRNLDALIALITRGAKRTDGGEITPLLQITVDQTTFEDTIDWLEDPNTHEVPILEPEPQRTGYGGRRCHLADGTPIHPLYAVAASVKAKFRRLVYDPKDRDLTVSYDSRSFPQWITDVLLVATNGKSANPVCDAPFSWLQTDHVQPHSHHGPTEFANGRPLSGADNGWRGNDLERGLWGAA